MEQSSPEHKFLESDMTRLAEIVQREKRESGADRLNDREIIRKSLQTFSGNTDSPTKLGVPRPSPLPGYTDDQSPELKLEVEYLLDLAFHKGILTAFAEAEKSSDLVKDAFHDALAGKLHEQLDPTLGDQRER